MYVEENDIADASAPNVSSTSIPDMLVPFSKETWIWIFVDCFLFIAIVLGNVLTIVAIAVTRRLRSVVSNYFVLNLAVSDLLVGVSMPYHLAFYVNDALSHDELICVSRFVLISVACGGSIYNIIVIAIDRYIAIVHPLSYNAHATTKRMLLVIAGMWLCTIGVSSIPFYWNRFNATSTCEFETVLPKYFCTRNDPFPLIILADRSDTVGESRLISCARRRHGYQLCTRRARARDITRRGGIIPLRLHPRRCAV